MFQKQKQTNAVKNVALGAAIAAAAGYVTGILTAPKSGRETRQEIKDSATKRKTAAEKELKKLHTELSDALTDAKTKGSEVSDKASKEMSDVLDKAKASKEKVRELLSALHEGDAEDKELKKAISDATKAIDHIKKFLDK